MNTATYHASPSLGTNFQTTGSDDRQLYSQASAVSQNNALYLTFNVSSMKVLIRDTIFTSPTGDGTAILRGHPSHAKVYPFAGQRKYLHFSVV